MGLNAGAPGHADLLQHGSTGVQGRQHRGHGGIVLNCGGPDILIPASNSVKSPAVVP